MIYDGTSGASGSYSPFSGSYQEIRYYATGIDENVFNGVFNRFGPFHDIPEI